MSYSVELHGVRCHPPSLAFSLRPHRAEVAISWTMVQAGSHAEGESPWCGTAGMRYELVCRGVWLKSLTFISWDLMGWIGLMKTCKGP